MDATETELAGQIKKHRQALGISQEALAEKIYVSRQTISNWETARTYPDVQSLLLLSVAFDISIDELIKGDVETMEESVRKADHSLIWMYAAEMLLTVIAIVALTALLRKTPHRALPACLFLRQLSPPLLGLALP